MPIPLQLPGTRLLRRPASPLLPVVIAAVAVTIGGIYLWRDKAVTDAALSPARADMSTQVADVTPAPAVSAGAPPVQHEDLRRHLRLTEEALLRSTEELHRAERAWTAVSTRLARNFLYDERRRAADGTDASRQARQHLERALEELHVAMHNLQ